MRSAAPPPSLRLPPGSRTGRSLSAATPSLSAVTDTRLESHRCQAMTTMHFSLNVSGGARRGGARSSGGDCRRWAGSGEQAGVRRDRVSCVAGFPPISRAPVFKIKRDACGHHGPARNCVKRPETAGKGRPDLALRLSSQVGSGRRVVQLPPRPPVPVTFAKITTGGRRAVLRRRPAPALRPPARSRARRGR